MFFKQTQYTCSEYSINFWNFKRCLGKTLFITISFEHITGLKVIATNPDIITQNARVQANSINSFPTKPSKKPIGKKTDASVVVMTTTAKPISFMDFILASKLVKPFEQYL